MSSVTTILTNLVGRSVVSAITQTPASGPLGLLTTPPRSALPMRTGSLLSWPARTPASVVAKSTPSTITIPGYKVLLLIISDLLPPPNHDLICGHPYPSISAASVSVCAASGPCAPMILHSYSRNHCLTAKCSLHLLTDYLPAELYICSVKLLPPLVTSSLKEGRIGGMPTRHLVQYHNPDKMG